MSEFSDPIRALAEIQATVIELRRVADETSDPRKRDACLRSLTLLSGTRAN